jgi:N-acetylmuramoyl-L-alanine amidase
MRVLRPRARLSAGGLAAAVLLCASLPGLAAASAVVRRVDLLADGPEAARLTLELSGPAARKVFTLEHPSRVVVDLAGTRLAPGLHLPASQGPVRSLRSGGQPGRTLRLVLELNSPQALKTRYEAAGKGGRLTLTLGHPAAVAATAARKPPGLAETSPAAEPEPQAQALAAVEPARAAHAPADSGRDIVIAIDAGHGGTDPGAIGHRGTQEKDVTLAIARALARRVEAEPGMHGYLTRDSDHFVELRDRIARARAAHADLFVSVHADSIANREVAGSSVYVLSERGASSEAARWLAERENAADLKGGVKLADKGGQLASVLMDLSQSASIGASMEAAERVLAHLDHVGEIRKSQVQQAAFVVLKSPDIPSMLVETAYISNPGEEARLTTAAHQDAVANAIFGGLREYFRRNPPDGTRYAQQKNRGAGPILAAGSP